MLRLTRWVCMLAAVAVVAWWIGAAAAQTGPASRLTIEQLIEIKHPSHPVWSPDGKHVAFLWDRADVVNLYVTDAAGSGKPVALTSFPGGKIGDVFWSKAGDTVYFSREGDLWRASVSGGPARAVWTTPSPEVEFARSPDGRRVAFVRARSAKEAQHGGDLVARPGRWFARSHPTGPGWARGTPRFAHARRGVLWVEQRAGLVQPRGQPP